MTFARKPRPLTAQERLAAEAAFAGRPFDTTWSEAARAVYDGICRTLGTVPHETVPAPPQARQEGRYEDPSHSTGQQVDFEIDPTHRNLLRAEAWDEIADHQPDLAERSADGVSDAASVEHVESTDSVSREEAIRAGVLIEVTPLAKRLGVPYTVGMTRPAWDIIVTASHRVPDDTHESRVRDILLALRLRLMSAPVNRSVIDFPALLIFPPDAVPQPQVLLAAFHDSPQAPSCITLLLPRELSRLLDESKSE
ncbi:MAG: hypothetical protein U0172_06330 [Nitrospiraceae bacterium]